MGNACSDLKEEGLSFKDARDAINDDIRHNRGLPLLRIGAIKGCVHHMTKRDVRLTKKAQGNYDKESDWVRARLNFSLQILLCTDRRSPPPTEWK